MGMQLIETVEVGSGGAASIEFTSIPQDGVDLMLVLSARASAILTQLRFNGDTTDANYSRLTLRGNGSTASSFSSDGSYTLLASSTSQTSNTFGNGSAYISNYTSTANKSISIDTVNENNATAADAYLWAYSYSTSSPITSLSIVGSLEQYSTASLHTISAD